MSEFYGGSVCFSDSSPFLKTSIDFKLLVHRFLWVKKAIVFLAAEIAFLSEPAQQALAVVSACGGQMCQDHAERIVTETLSLPR